ncbi:MAG: condensation domain-containing protein, partial [Stackebrandtia sp.]
MPALSLTAAAEGIGLGQLLDPGYPGYWTAECAAITGPVEVDRLADAVAATVVDAEALHARFPDTRSQLVDVDTAWRPEIVEVPADHGRLQIQSMIDERLAVPAELATGPLFASTLFVTPEAVYWFIKAHHIVLDGYGYALLYRQVSRHYNGRPVEGFGRLSEIVNDDARYRASPKADSDREYWNRLLAGPSPTSFAAETALPQRETLTTTIRASILDGAGPAWPHRLLATVAAALHRRTGTATPVLGLPVSGRLGTPAARVPGMV